MLQLVSRRFLKNWATLSGMELKYRSLITIEDLRPGECTVRRAADGGGKNWWNFWWYVPRETDGVLEVFVVAVIPGGSYTETGAGGRSWGLLRAAPGRWQINPSINVLDVESDDSDSTRHVITGIAPTGKSLWHQTPAVVDVPDGEPWQ